MNKDSQLVFIFGPQRTGSTLVHNLFKLHPDVYGTPNDLNMYNIAKKLFKLVSDKKQLKKLIDWKLDYFASLSPLLVGNKTDKQIFFQIIEQYFDGHTEKVLIHKNPKAEHDIINYRSIFPHAKYIFCVRNPMAVMASRKHWLQNTLWRETYPKDFISLINTFKYMQQQILDVLESYKIIEDNIDESDVLGIVQYEKLISNPKNALVLLTNSLGLDVESILENINNLKRPYSSYSSNMKKNGLYESSVGQWTKSLTQAEINLIATEVFKQQYRFTSPIMQSIISEYVTIIKQQRKKI